MKKSMKMYLCLTNLIVVFMLLLVTVHTIHDVSHEVDQHDCPICMVIHESSQAASGLLLPKTNVVFPLIFSFILPIVLCQTVYFCVSEQNLVTLKIKLSS